MKKLYLLSSLMLLALVLLCACSHEHRFEEEWSSDAYYHWHAADCRHEEERADHAPHNLTAAAEDYVCTDCGYTCTAQALTEKAISVALSHSFAPRNALVLVEGYFAGVSDGAGNNGKEILLKDKDSDALIAVKGLPAAYGTWPSVGYQRGDLVRILATVKDEIYNPNRENTQNRRYLLFSEQNGGLESTVISRANSVSYSLEDAVFLTSHAELKSLFKIDTLAPYTYVRIKGAVYLNARSSGAKEFRPYLNGAAAKNSETAPDGKRVLGFRENALLANIGTAWEEYFTAEWAESSVSVAAGRAQEVDIVAVCTGASDTGFHMTVLDASWLSPVAAVDEIRTPQEAIIEMALAYLRKGGLLEYDQFNGRRMVGAAPEEATAQSLVFLDCSSYVASVYYNTFGLKAIPDSYGSQNTKNYTAYAKANYGKADYPDVIGYYETLDYTTKEAQWALLAEVRNMLQPGDILVYRRGSARYGEDYSEGDLSGHAILYMGNGLFTHSTGTSFHDGGTASKLLYKDEPEFAKDRATTEEYMNGTVQWLSADSVLSVGSQNRMLFGDRENIVYNFSIIRPLERKGASLELTEQAEKRMAMPGLSFEKITSAGIYSAVCRGGEITYTLTVKNHGKKAYTGLSFSEILPAGVSLLASSIPLSQSGNALTGSFSIGAYETATITWTVKVGDALPVGTVLCNQTAVSGLFMKSIENNVSGYTQAELAAIADTAREYAQSGRTFSDPMEFVRAVYTEALGFDPFLGMSAEEMEEALFTNASGKMAIAESGAMASMVAPHLFGGSELYSTAVTNNNATVRTVYAHHLSVGDVIYCEWQGNYRVLIYLGEGELAAVDTRTLTCSLKENGSEKWHAESSRYVQDHYLASLFAYEKYAVLRPSQIAQ